ncbi:hypothetical protein [Nocardia sp. R6R-6]|uniref:hypothetical protein n=1 Tax=Nocardia sp. R6R-6 TaxID=3459303 RepID=UPI00403DDB3E
MTALATLCTVAVFGFLIYLFGPKRDERNFRLERFHPGIPLSDRTLSHYDYQRRYSDLAAIYSRADVPDPDWTDTEKAASRGDLQPRRPF